MPIGIPQFDQVANLIIAQMLFLAAEDPEKDISIYINSPGGSITAGLAIGAIPVRAPVHDVLVSRSGKRLAELPPGATIGTSSRRRAAQVSSRNPPWYRSLARSP